MPYAPAIAARKRPIDASTDSRSLNTAKPATNSVAPARATATTVPQATRDFLDHAWPQDLAGEHQLPGGLGATPASSLLGGVLDHSALHTGEIAALKGVEGRVGFPFL